MLVVLFVGAVGVSLVVLSDARSLDWANGATVGLLLAVVSTFVAAMSMAANQILAKDQRIPTPVSGCTAGPRDRADVSVAGNATGGFLAAPFIAAVGIVVSVPDWSLLWDTNGALLATVGAAIHIAANWGFHHANHLARDAHTHAAAQINTLYYLAPVSALVLLALFADTTIEHTVLFVVGLALVVAANMMRAVTHR